jgi:hypothetical protein
MRNSLNRLVGLMAVTIGAVLMLVEATKAMFRAMP